MSPELTPLTFGQIETEAEYYGVKVAAVGYDNETLYAFTHNRRRAIAAANAYVRNVIGEKLESLDEYAPGWKQFFGECGCVPHEVDPVAPHSECECVNQGVPPCGDDFAWISKRCEADALNAVAVLEFDWAC